MSTCYPKDRAEFMRKDGPVDARFRIPSGNLLYNPERDTRFPYIYCIETHELVHSEQIKKILIHVVDTSIETGIEQAKFHKTLEVPLGPNAGMVKNGTSIN